MGISTEHLSCPGTRQRRKVGASLVALLRSGPRPRRAVYRPLYLLNSGIGLSMKPAKSQRDGGNAVTSRRFFVIFLTGLWQQGIWPRVLPGKELETGKCIAESGCL